jgi:DNA-binding NtrC family response regulator
MEKRSTAIAGLTTLLDASRGPVYAIDGDLRLVYCNTALAAWLGMERAQIVGRYVEYHSVPPVEGEQQRTPGSLLTELCPPPAALAGRRCVGTIATVARDGRLIHRRAEFLPLGNEHPDDVLAPANGAAASRAGVLVVLAMADMSPEEVSAEVSADPTPDELHRTIRRFRHGQAETYAIEALVGTSSAIEKVRTQVTTAAASRAHFLVRGRRGIGRTHVARTIFYEWAAADTGAKLVPLDCAVATEDLLRRTLDSAGKRSGAAHRALLLLDLEQMPPELQTQVLAAIKEPSWGARVIATIADAPDATKSSVRLDRRLLDVISTITIDLPSLAGRLEDLPLVAHCFLESCNRGNVKQVGSVRSDALDILALYGWPGELEELRKVIAAAHAAATSFEITPADLPAVIHHAAKTAALPRRRPPEKIVLDELLATIEREAIQQAVAQAGGNKTAAAELLGMTRPRLYRRLVQLGLVSESAIEFEEDTSQ